MFEFATVRSEDLLDNPDNGERLEDTGDLELSIRQNGFIDPLDVTDFGTEPGKYMIVSGHRRRAAGVKTGMDEFPCVVRHFNNKGDMINCMLLSQSFRDSSKDPLLYAARYQMHKKYLEDSGFEGSVREEVARRLGMSTQQADRYAAMDKVIPEVWDYVREGKTSVSAVQPLASRLPATQERVLDMMKRLERSTDTGDPITREQVRLIVKQIEDSPYRTNEELCQQFEDDVKNGRDPLDRLRKGQAGEEAPLKPARAGSAAAGVLINDKPSESRPSESRGREEPGRGFRREYDAIGAELDRMDRDEAEWRKRNAVPEDGAEDSLGDGAGIMEESLNDIADYINSLGDGGLDGLDSAKPRKTEREKRIEKGRELIGMVRKLEGFLKNPDEEWLAEDPGEAVRILCDTAGLLMVAANDTAVFSGDTSAFIEGKRGVRDIIDSLA